MAASRSGARSKLVPEPPRATRIQPRHIRMHILGDQMCLAKYLSCSDKRGHKPKKTLFPTKFRVEPLAERRKQKKEEKGRKKNQNLP